MKVQAEWMVASATLIAIAGFALDVRGQTTTTGSPADIRLGNNLRIIRVKPGAQGAAPLMADRVSTFSAQSATPFPRPPLNGFSPLVAITTSNKKKPSSQQDTAHVLESTYSGLPLNAPAEENFVVGILDTGAILHIVTEPYTSIVGLESAYTGNIFPIGGVGGDSVNGIVTYPIGFFAAGLGAVNSSGQLDLTQLKGHSNVSLIGLPELACGTGESLSAVVGTPMLAFYKSIIRVDTPREITVDGVTFKSPGVELRTTLDASTLAQFPRALSMTASGGGLPVTTASYYPDITDPEGPDFDEPFFPTMLTLYPTAISFGALFRANIGLLEGEPGPTNPLQTITVVVDTGAQASIISQGVAANLNLNLNNPDFTIDVCGIGGTSLDVPGFYVDYVRMNASGGALEFSQAPFVVLDVINPDGSPLDGILGMNFFWNRNVIFDSNLSGTSFLRISDPILLAFGDFDRDLDVDNDDFEFFTSCVSGPTIPLGDPVCPAADADGDGDVDQEDFGIFQACISGPAIPADPNCGPSQ